jgi:hypothetical protein
MLVMAWSPVRRFNAGRFEVDHPGDYATLISNQLRDGTVIGIMGDTESCMFAEEIHAFLKANGFKMKETNGISQGVFTRTPRGLIVEPDGDALKFVVGVAN